MTPAGSQKEHWYLYVSIIQLARRPSDEASFSLNLTRLKRSNLEIKHYMNSLVIAARGVIAESANLLQSRVRSSQENHHHKLSDSQQSM